MMRTLALVPLMLAASPALAQEAPAQHDHGSHDNTQIEAQEEAPTNHSSMDHSSMDHSAMDQGKMQDEPAMDHSMHQGQAVEPSAPTDTPGNAAPPPVPRDHAADAYFPPEVMAEARRALIKAMQFRGSVAKVDLLEYRARKGSDGYRAEGKVWHGGDIDRVEVAFDAEGSFGEAPESVEIDAYWRHAVNPWFNMQLGVRHDIRPDPERTYALVGIQGLAPYWIEVEAQAYVSNKGDVHFNAIAMHDWRLTQNLVFEPEAEIDMALQDVPELGIGAGLDKIELSARMRYEIERNFAPYIGVSWERKLGESADYSRAEGESASTVSFVAGLRFWF
jgi:copper resistance protein B